MSAALFKKAKQKALYLAILGMFSNNVPGLVLDANDWGPTGTGGTGVVFQDLSGTAVTAMEQPVQLILDKSQGLKLGSELIVNGSNPTTTTGWTPNAGSTLTVVSNKFRVQGQESYQAYATVVGALYKCSVDIAVVNPGAVYVGTAPRNAANYTTGQVAASATKQFYFIATATTTYLSMLPWNAGTEYCDFNNITVKKIAGNHAYVSASANRPTISARYNLLTKTEDFSADWVIAGFTRASSTEIAPDGTATAVKLTENNTDSNPRAYQLITASSDSRKYIAYLKASAPTTINFSTTGGLANSVSLTTAWQAVSVTQAVSNSVGGLIGGFSSVARGSGISIYVWHPDLRPSDQATGLIPTYQRVNTATDYDWSPAFPPMIRGNGSNQYLTGNLDLSSTNKVTVWAGVRKTSDANGMLAELSTNGDSTTGTFYVANIGQAWRFALGGAGAVYDDATTFAAPKTNVLSSLYDQSAGTPATKIVPRVNAATPTLAVNGTLGSGNFTSNPYYLLSRAGSSLFFNGGFNTLIVLGAAATAAQISTTEAYCNQKLRAY